MAKEHRGRDEEAWKNATKVCRLNSRQVEMARALGMNPKKLPGLRPGPRQRWKLPVGAFIEESYRKRFGRPIEGQPGEQEPPSRTLRPDSRAPELLGDQVRDLICYLVNLADDLQEWLVRGSVAKEVLPQVSEELREVAAALDTGASISPMPGIPVPPPRKRRLPSRLGGRERTFDDDDIPF
jgi:hypothetical protein